MRSRKRDEAALPLLGGCSRREHIIGDSVSAMTPETTTEPASVKANSRNSAPVTPGDEADRRIDGGERDRHRDDRAARSRARP